MSKGQSFAGDALWCHQDSSAPFRWVFCWGVESQHFFAQRRRPAVLLGRNRQLCEPWQTMLSLSPIHVKTWLRVKKWSFSKDGSSEQSYASFSASVRKGAAFFGLEMQWTSVRNLWRLSRIPSDLEQLKVWLPCFNSGHQPPLMHPMLPMPLSLFRGLHNLSNLAKAIIIYIHLYPFITLSSVVFDIIALNWGLQVTMDSVCNRVSALPIQARWLLRSSANMKDIQQPGSRLPSTLIYCHLCWGTATVCRAHNCRYALRFALGSAFVMWVWCAAWRKCWANT